MKYLIMVFCFFATTMCEVAKLQAQVADNYTLSLEPLSISGFSGLQSYAKAQYQDKLLLIGGRTDGLHRRQPFASFAASDNNTDIVVSCSSQLLWHSA